MSQDALVASAISHWAPRFVANGVLLSDFEEVTAGVVRWADWCAAWCARGEVHEQLGREALKAGYRLTAGEHLTRAAMYYHFAKFVFVQDVAQMRAAHERAVACYADALPLLRPPGERVAIPFEGKALYAVLRRPPGVTRSPVLVMAPGLDSTKEELHAYEEPFLARGIAVLAIDGPGQGEAEYDIPIRGDYEAAGRAACDWIATRDDLDAARIAMWGVSLGGYYAPRAVSGEPRFKACIAISGPFEWQPIWDQLPGLTRAAFRVRSHSADDAAARQRAGELTLRPVAAQIRCPIFIVAGRQDRIVPADHGEWLAGSVSGPVNLLIVENAGHNANDRPYRYRSQTADWLADLFGLPRA